MKQVDRPTPEARRFRMKMAVGVSPPTAEDWIVTVWYRGFDGRDHRKHIRIGSIRNPGAPIEITEEEAVKQALASLRRYVVNTRRAGWDEIPRAYDVRAVPRHRIGAQKVETQIEDLLQKFRSMNV